MRKELDFLIYSNKYLKTAYLNDDEWEQVQSMIVLLELMYKAIKILSSSSKLLTFSFRDQHDTAINQLRLKMVLYTLS